jgi:hypothetical protein
VVIAVHPLYADHPESKRLDQVDSNITRAEAAYRANPKLAADLETTGWCEHRFAAAREGRAVASDGCQQQEPAFQFAPEPSRGRSSRASPPGRASPSSAGR